METNEHTLKEMWETVKYTNIRNTGIMGRKESENTLAEQ